MNIKPEIWGRVTDRFKDFKETIPFPPVGDWHSGTGYAIDGEPFKESYFKGKAGDKSAMAQFSERRNKVAKVVGLAMSYGGSGYTIAHKTGCTVEQGDNIVRKFFGMFGTFEFHLKRVLEWANREYLVRDVFGRIRYLPKLALTGFDIATKKIRSAMRRLVYNAPVQTSGSTQLKAMMVVQNRYLENGKLNRHLGNLRVNYKPYTRIVTVGVDKVTDDLRNTVHGLPDGNTKVLVLSPEGVPVEEYSRPVQMRMGIIRKFGMEVYW